jgi:hypothetical protein
MGRGNLARRLGTAALTLCAGALLATSAQAATVAFAPPRFVDTTLAGGEPVLMADPAHHTLVYTTHEGTTHLYRNGFFGSATVQLLANYRNQVNIWVSKDNGATWKLDNLGGSGFNTDPTKSTGFSDPDLTQDEGGALYNTGIDLANQSLYSSTDGGQTWDRGTAQCHDGDRPWLAGASKDVVYMGTDPAEDQLSHRIFKSTDGGQTCSLTGTADFGPFGSGHSYNGFGKLYFDHALRKLAEPVVITNSDGKVDGVGVSTGTFENGMTPVKVADTTLMAHWPALSIDAAHNIYLVWDTDDRTPGTSGGCDGAQTPATNSILMAESRDFGKTWSKPITITHPTGTRAMWPWVTAGDKGRVSVVWWQMDHAADINCQPAKLYVYDAQVTGADSASPSVNVVNASGRPVHEGTVCQAGTDCVATGVDRRVGDFFTNAVDANGCVVIGTSDTTMPDPVTGGPRIVSLPLFIQQTSGPRLVGSGDCSQKSGAPALSAGGPTCRDTLAPATRYRRGRASFSSRRRLAVSGSARDRGCGGRVARVQVAIARRLVGANTAHKRTRACRFVTQGGALGAPRPCASRRWLTARGTTAWKLKLARRLPAGYYESWVRGVDAAGHAERVSRRNTRTFRLA